MITKDSESFNDIGVPAYVAGAADDLVCGYHLAILRRKSPELNGQYLYWALRAPAIVHQLHVAAGGVTRFGLSHEDIKSIRIPVPPAEEQAAIVKYLAHADARIDKAIAAKRRLIALLRERRDFDALELVSDAVATAGSSVPSGHEWLGDVPASWTKIRAKAILEDIDERSETGAEEILSVSHLTGVTPRSEKQITMSEAQSYVGHKLC